MKRPEKEKRKFKPRLISQPPHRETKFLRVLEGWTGVTAEDPFAPGTLEFIFSPERKVYRRAHSWETPELVIDADILPAAHHIRLVRVRNLQIRKLARKLLRKQERLQRRSRKPED